MSNGTLAEVVSFWREARPERWFGKDDGFDLTIRTRFLAIHEAAARHTNGVCLSGGSASA